MAATPSVILSVGYKIHELTLEVTARFFYGVHRTPKQVKLDA
jgi:hypothetical protein